MFNRKSRWGEWHTPWGIFALGWVWEWWTRLLRQWQWTNNPVIRRNTVFTLQDRYEPQSGRHIYYSTAVGNKITKRLRIGCSDGRIVKYCNISVIGKCTQQCKKGNWVTCTIATVFRFFVYYLLYRCPKTNLGVKFALRFYQRQSIYILESTIYWWKML